MHANDMRNTNTVRSENWLLNRDVTYPTPGIIIGPIPATTKKVVD